MRTSGKAPLEKTLQNGAVSSTRCSGGLQMAMRCFGVEATAALERAAENENGRWSNSHQQTGFTAGTVADDDELSADLSHGVCVVLRSGR